MTKIEFLTQLTDSAVRYKKEWQSSLARNCHMNNLARIYKVDEEKIWERDQKELERLKSKVAGNITEEVVDAILVDFINKIGVEQGVDYALYTKDLKTHKPQWE